MDKKRDPGSAAAEFFNLPADAFAGMPKLTVTGCRRVMVENHRGIIEYGREIIEINGGRVRLRIHGSDLELIAMTKSELLVQGNIFSVEFE